jgi:hypothetical protein
MAISLYDVSVPSYLQTIGAVSAFLDKGLAYCTEKGVDPTEFVETRLFPDMLPLSFQIVSVAHHSIGAIEGIKQGVFAPPHAQMPKNYAGLQAMVAEARLALEAVKPEDVNVLEGRDMLFQLGEVKMPFTAEGFILSFSLPNFYFHATTAYDILRFKGVPLGKRHFMGKMRMKG